MIRRSLATAATLVVAALLAGCASQESGPVVATFEVAGGETFAVELATPELIEHAQDLLAGKNVAAIPLGRVVRNDPSVNEPWSWHLDPATFQFAQVTTEVCDGIPSYVEDETVTSPDYCPWSAKIIAIDGLPGD